MIDENRVIQNFNELFGFDLRSNPIALKQFIKVYQVADDEDHDMYELIKIYLLYRGDIKRESDTIKVLIQKFQELFREFIQIYVGKPFSIERGMVINEDI